MGLNVWGPGPVSRAKMKPRVSASVEPLRIKMYHNSVQFSRRHGCLNPPFNQSTTSPIARQAKINIYKKTQKDTQPHFGWWVMGDVIGAGLHYGPAALNE